MRRMRGVLLVVVGTLLVPTLGWGVVLDLNVSGGAGPVTLTLTESDGATREVTTDASGKAAVEVKPGALRVETRDDDHVRETWALTIPDTPRTSVTIPVTPVQPWMVQNPGRLGSFGLGLGYEGRWYEGIRITRHETTVTRRVNDTVIDSTTILEDPADVNRMVRFDFETNVAFLDVPFGIWAGDLGWGRLQVGGSPLIGGGGVTLTFLDRESGDRTEFDGETVILGFGLEAVLVPCPEPCPWFVRLGFTYRTDVDTSVRRKPSPSEPGLAIDDEVELGHEGWTVSARGGYVLRPRARFLRSVAPWIGLQYDRLEVTVSERTLVTSPQFPGRSVTVDFRGKFESESVQGLVGVDAHLWGPFFARLAVAFDDCDVAVLTKLVYAFGVTGR